MVRMTDSEFLKVIPQFLGITLACGFFGTLHANKSLLAIGAGVLILLIVRIRFLYTLGTLIHDSLALIGRSITSFILGALYLTVISAYAIVYRARNRALLRKFTFSRSEKSTYEDGIGVYEKKSFEKLW